MIRFGDKRKEQPVKLLLASLATVLSAYRLPHSAFRILPHHPYITTITLRICPSRFCTGLTESFTSSPVRGSITGRSEIG